MAAGALRGRERERFRYRRRPWLCPRAARLAPHDRGPDVIGALAAWAEDEQACSVDRIDRIVGNHEQVFLMAIGEGPRAAKAAAMWRSKAMGGETFLKEMRARVGDAEAPLGRALAEDALGAAVLGHLEAQLPHVTIGNTLFVHGGIDPRADRAQYLARPWRGALEEAQYAWIMEGFLDWRGGFGGLMVVHGHTPPPRHRALTGQADPHLFMESRLGLDGGSARTGYVTAAQIEDGRCRIFRAGTLLDPAML
jgi:serine/threonine protein phosphatase 1